MDGQIVAVNDAFARATGLEPPIALWSVVDLCDQSVEQSAVQAALAASQTTHLTVQLGVMSAMAQPVTLSFKPLTARSNLRLVVVSGEGLTGTQAGSVAPPLVRSSSLVEASDRSSSVGLAQTQALNQILQAIHQSLELRDVFAQVTGAIAQLLQANRVTVLHYSSQQGGWFGVSGDDSMHGAAPRWPAVTELVLPDADGQVVRALAQHDVLTVRGVKNGIRAIAPPSRGVLQSTFPSNWALATLRDEPATVNGLVSGIWGGLVLERDAHTQPWHPSELSLLQTIAHQLSIALHQAKRYRQVNRLNAELERQVQARNVQLQRANEFEQLLKRITEKVRDSLDEDQILQTAVQELAIAIEAHSCNVAIYDVLRGTSTICYEYATSGCSFQGHITCMDDLPELYEPLLKGQVLEFCPLITDESRGPVAILACPMRDDQGILGDLWLVREKFSVFSEPDQRLVQMVANQCAIALRQSRLFQAAHAQVAELERLHQLKDDFLSTISHELRTPMANIKMAIHMLEISLVQAELLPACSVSIEPAGSSVDAPFLTQSTRQETDPLSAQPEPQSEAHLLPPSSQRTHRSIHRYFSILNQECNRETKLITDLLDYSRLDAEAHPLALTTLNLQVWLPRVTAPFITRAHDNHQQFDLCLPPHLPPLTTDLNLLERVLLELLDNACRYTPRCGSVLFSVQYHAAPEESPDCIPEIHADRISAPLSTSAKQLFTNPASDRGSDAEAGSAFDSAVLDSDAPDSAAPSAMASGTIELCVANTGANISQGELSQIFEMFYHGPSNTRRYGSMGLGLALVKKLVHPLGGTISVEQSDDWIAFCVSLPQSRRMSSVPGML
jgi:signal transduction histidine kinase/cell fate (sporulation/competence/biofilm development) regulator YlbF (YheA/YmcA/DUF963 family)